MKFKREGWIVLLIAFGLQAQAQDSKTLTLDEAIRLSLQNNKQLKSSAARIDEATAALREANDKKLPNASISGSYIRLNTANIDLKTKSNNGGGTQGESPNVNQAVYGLLNITMPVYQGGKIRFGIESAALLKKATQLDAESEQGEVIQTTIESFANLFKANTAVKLYQEHLRQSEQRVKELTDLEKNGLLARNDLLKAQWQSSNVELNLLDAENNLQIANLNMNLMLGLPAATQIQLDTTGIERKSDSRVLDDYLQAAQYARRDAMALDYRKQAAESGVKSTKAEMLPSLQLTGGYIAADIPNVLTVTNAMNVGVGLSYNIGSLWKNKAKVQQAQARVRQLEIAESIKQDQITIDVNKSYLDLLSSRKKIDVMAKALEQAQENYRIVKNKFDNNLATTSDLLEADVARFQSGLAYTLSRADAFVAYHKLLQSTGLLNTEWNK